VGGLAGTWAGLQQQLLTELVQRHVFRPVTEVATAVGLADFDSPAFHDRLQRAQQTAMVRPLQVTTAVLTLSRGLFGLAGVVAALFVLSPPLLAVALLGLVPLWLATVRIARAVYEFLVEMTPNDRRRGYLLGLLTSRQGAGEVRAFGLGGYLRDLYEQLTEERLAPCAGTCVAGPGWRSWARPATPWPVGS
jgi:ATP-binding cassette subfamily B protein